MRLQLDSADFPWMRLVLVVLIACGIRSTSAHSQFEGSGLGSDSQINSVYDHQSHHQIDQSQWDLSGAQIIAVTQQVRQPWTDSIESDWLHYRVQWTAPPASSDDYAASADQSSIPLLSMQTPVNAPPLLYSVFAESKSRRSVRRVCSTRIREEDETSGLIVSATSNDAAASSSPSHNSTSADAFDSPSSESSSYSASAVFNPLTCLIRLPRGKDVWNLHLLVECDYQGAVKRQSAVHTYAEGTEADGLRWAMPQCHSAISVAVEMEAPADDIGSLSSVDTSMHSASDRVNSFAAAPGVYRIANDTQVRTALCQFFNLTSGPSWGKSTGWCNPNVPICGNSTQSGWYGIGCDSSLQFITSMQLRANGLTTASSADVSFVFPWLHKLIQLDWSANNLALSQPLDLTPLSSLETLIVSNIQSANPLNSSVPILFPQHCNLTSVDTSYTAFELSSMTRCQLLAMWKCTGVISPGLRPNVIPFAFITSFPQLRSLDAQWATFSDQPAGVYVGRSGVVTPLVLANLGITNPLLHSLILGGATLPFGSANATDTWPHIVSPSLQSLSLAAILSLRTGPTGPIDMLWLAGMPALQTLRIDSLLHATIHTSAFSFASASLSVIRAGDTNVVGDLSPLSGLSQLSYLDLSHTGLESTLPSNISSVWPLLEYIFLSSNSVFGFLPSFENMTMLSQIRFQQNNLVGPIGASFGRGCPLLTIVTLASNALQDPAPSFCETGTTSAFNTIDLSFNQLRTFPNLTCWSTQTLQLQGNPFDAGQRLPLNFWQLLPQLSSFDVSGTLLEGKIPDRPVMPFFQFQSFSVADCRFSGALPRNIDATSVDYSNNNFSGPVILFDEGSGLEVQTINLESAGALTCPIALGETQLLSKLILANSGFAGCDFTDKSMVQLPSSLTTIDISDCDWKPMVLPLSSKWLNLRANRANLIGATAEMSSPCLMLSIELDGNTLSNLNDQLQGFNSVLEWAALSATLQTFSCSSCELTMSCADLFSIWQGIVHLRFNSNRLYGRISDSIVIANGLSAPLETIDLQNNPNLRGSLPTATGNFPALNTILVAGTGITGSIPSSWHLLAALQQLGMQNTTIMCSLIVDADNRIQCADQSILLTSPTSSVEFSSRADSSAGVHCRSFLIASTGSSDVQVDPAYHSYTECDCDANSFGLNAVCYRCPDGCSCIKDQIQNCYPVMSRGSINVQSAFDASGSRSVIDGSIVPFTVTALLPCLRTVTGESLCNPDYNRWPSFYQINQQQAGFDGFTFAPYDRNTDSFLSTSSSSSAKHDSLDLSGWCVAGHIGRLCSACSTGYFSSGRWCLQCLSEGVHVLILCANLLLIAALIVYLYVKSPSAVNAIKGLTLYHKRINQSMHSAEEDRSMDSINRNASDAAVPNLSASSSFSSADGVACAVDADDSSASANPLKLLIFHCQQLSLLLHTSVSFPPVLAGMLSALTSGSSGFSLSSLVAMECLTHWTLATRCWMAVITPMVITAVAAITAVVNQKCRGESTVRQQKQIRLREEPLLASDSMHSGIRNHESAQESTAVPIPSDVFAGVSTGSPSSSIAPRIYSVCVSLLYFLVFPCAQTVLSAVSCTDNRESNQSYLNLYPDVACDEEWRRTVMPPALLGVILWVVIFPIGSTVWLIRVRSQLSSDASNVLAASSPLSLVTATGASSSLSVWPLCADLISSYRPHYWYWEQVLLVSRLGLVIAVAVIPASSLYLPLVLFVLIQFSTLLTHWSQPHSHRFLNVGELTSLYLLLINYISAIVLQSGLVEGGFHRSANKWATVLFVVNFIFILILVAGLFQLIRGWMGVNWTKLTAACDKYDGCCRRSLSQRIPRPNAIKVTMGW